MKWYAVARIEVTDSAWVRDYVRDVTRMVERRGGRYLARTERAEVVEGDPDARVVHLLVEWPSKETADAFYESDEYRPYRERRQRGARNEMLLVAGEDMTGRAAVAG